MFYSYFWGRCEVGYFRVRLLGGFRDKVYVGGGS